MILYWFFFSKFFFEKKMFEKFFWNKKIQYKIIKNNHFLLLPFFENLNFLSSCLPALPKRPISGWKWSHGQAFVTPYLISHWLKVIVMPTCLYIFSNFHIVADASGGGCGWWGIQCNFWFTSCLLRKVGWIHIQVIFLLRVIHWTNSFMSNHPLLSFRSQFLQGHPWQKFIKYIHQLLGWCYFWFW